MIWLASDIHRKDQTQLYDKLFKVFFWNQLLKVGYWL